MVVPTCPRCAAEVSLHEGRPAVTVAGHVELWHLDCWELRDVPVEAPVPAANPGTIVRSRRQQMMALFASRRARIAGGVAAVALVGGCLAVAMRSADVEAPELAPQLATASREPLAIRGAMPTREDPPPREARVLKPV